MPTAAAAWLSTVSAAFCSQHMPYSRPLICQLCWVAQDIFACYFETSVQSPGPQGCSVYKTAWLLFLYAKARLLPPFPDLVSAFNLLLCIMNLLLAHVPLQHHCFPPSDAQR